MADKYWISTEINGKPIGEIRRPITDPFIQHTVHLRWWDVVRSLLRGRRWIDITITVGCDDHELVEQVRQLSTQMDALREPPEGER